MGPAPAPKLTNRALVCEPQTLSPEPLTLHPGVQWAPSAELRWAAEAACELLHHRQEGAAAGQLQEALLSAARAAVAVCPEMAACMVLALKEADLRSGDCVQECE